MLLERLARELPCYRYRFRDERQLHNGISAVLQLLDVPHQREVIASETDRFDFLCAGGLVIEAKIAGSWSEAISQVDRYCQRTAVTAVIVATSRLWGLTHSKNTALAFRGKPVRVVHLEAPAF